MIVYLVYLFYDDGQTYDSAAYNYVFAAFDSKNKAIDFCKKNSDVFNEEYDIYNILTERDITDPDTGDVKKIKPRVYDDVLGIGHYYWFRIKELNVL